MVLHVFGKHQECMVAIPSSLYGTLRQGHIKESIHLKCFHLIYSTKIVEVHTLYSSQKHYNASSLL